MNTPRLETERLILRKFTEDDLEALHAIYSDEEVNRFLPWFPLKSMEEARVFFEARYAAVYARPQGYAYAVCLKANGVPVGYVHVDAGESHDFGYGLHRDFWRQGIITEAGAAVIAQVKKDGLPYVTATHDVNNPRSGAVMRRLGMRYCYTYEEQWMPKNFPVRFRLYQLNFDGGGAVYRKYWEMYPVHFIEENL